MRKFLLYCFCFILLFSCTSKRTQNKYDKYGGTLRLAIYDVTFDEYIFSPTIVCDLEKMLGGIFYDGLFSINPFSLSTENSICKSWDVDNTGLIYVFHLDSTAVFTKDDCFPNGTRNVNAYDVKYTFHILSNPTIGTTNFTNTVYHIKGAKEYYSMPKEIRDTSRIEGITVVDNYTLKITLDKPSPRFIQNLAHPSAAIIPFEAVEKYGNKSTIGVGPFRYQTDSTHFIFVRNPQYYKFDAKKNRLPYLDSIVITRVPDFESTIDLFVDNEIDAMLMVSGNKIATIQQLIPDSVHYEIVESNGVNLHGNGKLYNIIRSNVKGIYTNKMNILNFSEVYKERN